MKMYVHRTWVNKDLVDDICGESYQVSFYLLFYVDSLQRFLK
jgi:hypothetical protein